MRIFLDANILFSAAKTDGAVRKLLGMLLGSRHECWVDDYVVAEARRNLVAKGPAALTALDQLLTRCRLAAAQALPRGTADPETDWLADKDRPVLAAAIRLRCAVLLTGDRTHFGTSYGREFSGVVIHLPRSLAEALFV